MVRVVRSLAAEKDLVAILEYGLDRWGVDDALAFALSFEGADQLLAGYPEIGRARPELGDGIRSWLHRGYILFYRYEEGQVTIARILHGAADPGALEDWD